MKRGAAIALALATLSLASCFHSGNYENESDRLRAQVMELEAQNASLLKRQAELDGQLAQAVRPPESLPTDIAANQPVVASIAIQGLSHAGDSNNDGRIDQLLIYVESTDGLSRFTQMVGRLSATAAILPADADAITIGRVTLSPGELRQAYRSTLLGVHYTIAMPIEVPPGRERDSCAVAVTYEDGLTGQTHKADAMIDLAKIRTAQGP